MKSNLYPQFRNIIPNVPTLENFENTKGSRKILASQLVQLRMIYLEVDKMKNPKLKIYNEQTLRNPVNKNNLIGNRK